MNTSNSSNIFSFLAVVFLALAGNLAYFIYYHHNEPACGTYCVIFFNLAVLGLFLPRVAPTVFRSRHLTSSLSILSGVYFIIETIVAWVMITNNNNPRESLVTQLVIFLLFISLMLYIMGANKRTDATLKETRAIASGSLLQTKAILSQALATVTTGSSHTRSILRSALADINASPLTTTPQTATLEESILLAAKQLTANPDDNIYQNFVNLVRQRNSLIRSLNY